MINTFSYSQNNCVVSPISGPNIITGAGTVSASFYVTSNGNHIWTLPNDASMAYNNANGHDSIVVSFAPSFTSGTITVRRNSPNCANITQSILVTRNVCNMSIDAGSDKLVYYGYAPLECTELSVNISNGTAPYSYSWSDGSTSSINNVCPTSATEYEITVTDANGCNATDNVNVNVIDVRCYAGKSTIQKVEICHKNGKTLCINASAVPAHLAHGCSLGSCAEHNNDTYKTFIENSSDITEYEEPVQISRINQNSLRLTFNYELENEFYQILNISGQIVMTGSINGNNLTLDISPLNKGIYFINIINSEFEVEKFVRF